MEKKSRRAFVKDVTKVGALATTGLVPSQSILANTEALEGSENIQEPHYFLTPPYLQNLMPNAVDILFVTNNKAHSWVEYGEQETTLKANALEDGFVVAYNRVNRIRLENLQPDTTYSYRICSKEILKFEPYNLEYGRKTNTDVFTFKTPKTHEDECNCIIFNDIHERAYSFSELLNVNGDRKFDFVILNGDMFDFEENEAQVIRNLLNPCANLFAKNKPYIMLRGNHETRGKFRGELKNYFSYPEDEYYFSLRKGPVHFTFIDTGEDKTDDNREYFGIVSFDAFREKQAKWFDDLAQRPDFKKAPFRVVCMHIPPFHSGGAHGTMHCRKLFSPLFEKHKVDMVIAGHTHRYGVHRPNDEHAYPLIIGGGPKQGTRTIINLNATRKKLTVEMLDDSGTLVGNYSVKK